MGANSADAPVGGPIDPTAYAYAGFDVSPDPSHRPLYLAPVLKYLKGLPDGAAVLDAGCGGGDFSIGLNEAGFTVFGLDMSPTGIAHAASLGIGEFRVASVYEPLGAPFGRETFDAIVNVEVIEHLYSPYTFAQRAFEALVPGGTLVVTTPYWGYFKNLALALTNRTDKALSVLWEGGHIKHFSRATLTRLMHDTGFEEVGFTGRSEGLRALVPGVWSGMAMAFRKPGGA